MRKIKNITIGADPELFIINTSTGDVVSAIGLLPGKKDKPYKKGMPKGFGVEIDGILGEFNIPPCTSKEEYVDSIKYMKNWIKNYIKNIDPNLDICCKATMLVPEDQLLNPLANEIGCDPDFNAYTMDKNPKPEGYSNCLRVAGDHIHIGYTKPDPEISCMLMKYMDLACGIPSVLYDDDIYRRTLYGQAGSFRLPDYGLEARTLSSFMLNDDLLPKVWDWTMKAIELYNDGYPLPDGNLVQKCINTSNQVLAKHLIKLYDICAE
jgi:hypothetical protein